MPKSNPFDTFSSVGRNMKGFITDTWDTVGWEVDSKSGLPEHDEAAEYLSVEWIARLSYMDIPKQGVFVHVDVQWGHPAFGRVMDAAMGAFTGVDKDAILDVESEQGNFTIPFSEYRKLARMAPDPDDYEHGDQDDEFKADVAALITTIKKTQTASQLIREGTDPKGFDFANRHYEAEEHRHLTTNPPVRGELNNITVAELEDAMRRSPGRRTLTIKGQRISGLKPIGSRFWFEYHCNESHDSADAELWYHSHQRAEVVSLEGSEPPVFESGKQRSDSAMPLSYQIRFDDGSVFTAVEDELFDSQTQFFRPDPPRRMATNPPVQSNPRRLRSCNAGRGVAYTDIAHRGGDNALWIWRDGKLLVESGGQGGEFNHTEVFCPSEREWYGRFEPGTGRVSAAAPEGWKHGIPHDLLDALKIEFGEGSEIIEFNPPVRPNPIPIALKRAADRVAATLADEQTENYRSLDFCEPIAQRAWELFAELGIDAPVARDGSHHFNEVSFQGKTYVVDFWERVYDDQGEPVPDEESGSGYLCAIKRPPEIRLKPISMNPPPKPPSDRFLHSTCGLMGEPGVDYVLSYDPVFPLSETGSDAEFFDSENKSGEYDGMIEGWSKHPEEEPVVLCADGHILDGWHRLGLANKLGWKTIPAWVVRRGSAGAKSQIGGICSEYATNPPGKFSTQLGYGGIPEGFKIESPAGTTAIGYVSNADFPNDSSSPTRGELFLVNVREGQRKRGEGMSISIQALRLMKEHGCSTVNMSAISKGGAAIVDRLIREGYISEAIRTSTTGKSEHRIGLSQNPPPKHFWGKAGAGILFHCTADDTYLLTLRSESVQQPGTLGIPGGACGAEGMFTGKEGKQIGKSQAWVCAMRETKEELSWWPKQKQVAQVVLFQKANFQYQTFIVDIPASEKAEAERSIKLNWENDDHVWMSIPEMVEAHEQLHFGIQHVLEQIDA